MSTNARELYASTVRRLPERERLQLAALILEELTQTPNPHSNDTAADAKQFESLIGAVSLGHPTGVDNEQIDADLASEYAATHEAKG